jgi:hypothetical protein
LRLEASGTGPANSSLQPVDSIGTDFQVAFDGGTADFDGVARDTTFAKFTHFDAHANATSDGCRYWDGRCQPPGENGPCEAEGVGCEPTVPVDSGLRSSRPGRFASSAVPTNPSPRGRFPLGGFQTKR